MIKKSFNFEENLVSRIDEFRFAKRYKSEREVVVEALDIGLGEMEKRGAKDGSDTSDPRQKTY